MIQDTSRWAYALATQNLNQKQKAVIDALRFFRNATNAEVAQHLGWEINRVTPRVLELRKLGKIIDTGRRTCKVTGNTAHAWRSAYAYMPEEVKEATKPAGLFK